MKKRVHSSLKALVITAVDHFLCTFCQKVVFLQLSQKFSCSLIFSYSPVLWRKKLYLVTGTCSFRWQLYCSQPVSSSVFWSDILSVAFIILIIMYSLCLILGSASAFQSVWHIYSRSTVVLSSRLQDKFMRPFLLLCHIFSFKRTTCYKHVSLILKFIYLCGWSSKHCSGRSHVYR